MHATEVTLKKCGAVKIILGPKQYYYFLQVIK
jgi:hypothetical protein